MTASDNIAVTRVELYVDGNYLGMSSSSSPLFSWNSNKAGKGPHSLVARAYDAAGNMGTSATVTVYR